MRRLLQNKRLRPVSVYYLIAIPLVMFCSLSGKFRSGPCTPDLDVMAPLLFMLIAVVGFGVCFVIGMVRRSERSTYFSIGAIHGLALVLLPVLLSLLSAKR